MLVNHFVVLRVQMVVIVRRHSGLHLIDTRPLSLHDDTKPVAPVVRLLRVRIVGKAEEVGAEFLDNGKRLCIISVIQRVGLSGKVIMHTATTEQVRRTVEKESGVWVPVSENCRIVNDIIISP